MKRRAVAVLAVLGLIVSGCASATSATTQSVDTAATDPTRTTSTLTATTDASSQTTVDGDPERGRQIWADGGGVISGRCSACHSIDGTENTINPRQNAPSLLGISERAGSTVPGLSAEMYLRESILDPAAYVVEGYTAVMPSSYKFLLGEDDVNDLIAFLLTQ